MIGGIRIWGPTGLLELDENSFTVRVVYSALINSEYSGVRSVYIEIPGVTPTTHIGVCLPNGQYVGDPSGQNARLSQFDVQMLSGGVRVWFSNRNMPSGRLGASTQRLLVLRYR